jgi:hypothetical protein
LNEQEAGLGKFIKSWQEFSRKNAVLAPWVWGNSGGFGAVFDDNALGVGVCPAEVGVCEDQYAVYRV